MDIEELMTMLAIRADYGCLGDCKIYSAVTKIKEERDEALVKLAAMESQDPVYFWKEIGETDWMECGKDWYWKCVDSTEHDTKLLYAAPVPDNHFADERNMVDAWAVIAENGNIRAWASTRDHPTLKNLESEGCQVVQMALSPSTVKESFTAGGKSRPPRITEQDARDILDAYWNSSDVCGDWLKSVDGRALLNKLNADREQVPVVDAETHTSYCALNTINDDQVRKVVRAFWRRIYPYRNNYGIELPTPMPVEFMAHMATALTWVDNKSAPAVAVPDVFRDRLEMAHMCGQAFSGIDPSFSAAQQYANEALSWYSAVPSHSQQSADAAKSEALFDFAKKLEKWMDAQSERDFSDCINNIRIEALKDAIEYRDRCPSHDRGEA